ncbi:MAG TPA: calcium-binding EGF-like domain-containing protein [Chitinophagaceae bacterium]|nr:calcium-binding EGF-like domain-containing protein [Chitinophagaceae bacterium]
MQKVKVIGSTVLVFLLLAGSVLFNACIKDPCADMVCQNNGVCHDGRCKCAVGYEGPYCSFKMYEKFIGTWQGTYRCNGAFPDEETSIIAPGDKPNAITFYNIFTQNDVIKATVDGDQVVIEEQTIKNITYKGHGYVEGIYITLFIEEKNNDNGEVSACVYNATKFVQP